MALKDIRLVARYERKLIVRNKLFWIFAIIVLAGITGYQWLRQGGGQGYFIWGERALPSFMPFFNAWWYNLLQGIVIVFIGIDYVWRDRRLETNGVFEARPVTNTAYQAGKILGVLEVCFLLNVISMVLAMGIHLLFGDEGTFRLGIYFFYLLFLTLPTLFFVLGVALLVANRVNHHAVAILVLLSILALFYFVASDFVYGIFDPWGRALPLLFSDVTGVLRVEGVFLQRGAFFALGVGMLLLSTGMMKRLSDSDVTMRWVRGGGVFFILLGVGLGVLNFERYREVNHRRHVYQQVFREYAHVKYVHVKSHDIHLRQEGKRIHVRGELVVVNNREERVEEPVLFLNPGLTLISLTDEKGRGCVRERDEQVIILKDGLEPGEEIRLHVEYEGTPDEAVCYPDYTDEEFHDTHLTRAFYNHEMYRVGREYLRVGDDYTFLLPECLWYPVTVPPVNISLPLARNYDFTRFKLSVEVADGRVALSQGVAERQGSLTTFTNEQALPRLSLCIGKYERASVVYDSVEMEIYYFPGHDFFLQDYQTSSDSIGLLLEGPVDAIREFKGGFYPFRRLALVETPVNIVLSTRKGWKGSEFVQPEMVFLPEKAYSIHYDYVRRRSWHDPNRSRFDVEESIFYNFVIVNFQFDRYDFTPLFDDYSGYVTSVEYPCIGNVVNLLARKNGDINGPKIFYGDVQMDDFEMNAYWERKSMREAFVDDSLDVINLQGLLELKYKQMVHHLCAVFGKRELVDFVQDFKKRYLFSAPDFSLFEQEFEQRFGEDLRSVLSFYYDGKGLPAFLVKDVKIGTYEVEGEEEMILAEFKVYNPASVPGVITISGRTFPLQRGGGIQEYDYLIPARGSKEIRMIYGIRDLFKLEFNLSQNIPNHYFKNYSGELPKMEKGTTGIWDVDSMLFLHKEPGIVVDNEDAGFVIHEKVARDKLGSIFGKKVKKHQSYIYDAPNWTLTSDEAYYGDIVKSAYCRFAGKGRTKVEWKVNIVTPGMYEVFAYVPRISNSPYQDSFLKGARVFYEVGSSDGNREVELSLDTESPGWISLGTYSFGQAGEYSVFLSDLRDNSLKANPETEEEDDKVQLIVADAVKWVPVVK